jgi:uncharacterized protein (TIGR02996 family)
MPRYELYGEVWQIAQTGASIEIVAGGKTTVRKFITEQQATAQLDKLIEERVAAGYQLQLRDPRHPQLEAAIAQDPEHAAHYGVYGDWLESQGDPRGQLIALALAADAQPSPRLAAAIGKLRKEHADSLLGPLAKYATRDGEDKAFAWRYGFIRRADLQADRHGALDGALEQVLCHPSARFLVELALGRDPKLQPAIDVLIRLAPRSLRALRLWSVADLDLGRLWAAVPELRRLSLAGERLELGDLELAMLERVELCDAEMPRASVRVLARRLGRVQQLKLDFGRGTLTGAASIDDVLALLARGDLAQLAQLSLVNVRYASEVVRELVASPLAAQLKYLDLSNNQMLDPHAVELASFAARFPQLATLDVSFNRLSPAGIEALRGVAPTVRAGNQRGE